jgi:hypothetical protein
VVDLESGKPILGAFFEPFHSVGPERSPCQTSRVTV